MFTVIQCLSDLLTLVPQPKTNTQLISLYTSATLIDLSCYWHKLHQRFQ